MAQHSIAFSYHKPYLIKIPAIGGHPKCYMVSSVMYCPEDTWLKIETLQNSSDNKSTRFFVGTNPNNRLTSVTVIGNRCQELIKLNWFDIKIILPVLKLTAKILNFIARL